MASDLVKNCKGLSGLSACKCCCFVNMLGTKRLTSVTWGTLTCGCCFCRCKKFLVVPISCFKCSYKFFAESYHELGTVEYFSKSTVNVQYAPEFVYYFLYVWQH